MEEIHKALWVYFDKPERMRALYKLRQHMPRNELIKAFGEIWVNLESHFQDMPTIRQLIEFINLTPAQLRFNLMEADERSSWQRLASKRNIRIYRGCWQDNLDGWSWTTSLDVATKFAKRHAPDGFPVVACGYVKPADVLAYFTRRGENEIVVDAANVYERTVVKLEYQAPKATNLLFSAIQAGNFHSREQRKEHMLMSASLDTVRYLGFMEERMAFFRKYGFTEEYQLFNEVKEELRHAS